MTSRLNLARPSPDRIIEANRPRDWFDAHCDYAVTGKASYRDERLAHEQSDDDPTSAMAVVGYVLAGALTVFVLLIGIPMYCLLLKWTGGVL